MQQSFKDALTRNKITVQPPIPSPAARVGNGYVQMVQSADAPAGHYMVAQSDQSARPTWWAARCWRRGRRWAERAARSDIRSSDLSAGGTQRFENGAALAGNPVRLVSGGILTKWALLGL